MTFMIKCEEKQDEHYSVKRIKNPLKIIYPKIQVLIKQDEYEFKRCRKQTTAALQSIIVQKMHEDKNGPMKALSNEKENTSIYNVEAAIKKGYSIDSRFPLYGLIEEDDGSYLKSDSSFEISEKCEEYKDEEPKNWESLGSIESDEDKKLSKISCFELNHQKIHLKDKFIISGKSSS
jgi:hypothetical protein